MIGQGGGKWRAGIGYVKIVLTAPWYPLCYVSGRLIRKSAYRGDSKSTAYIVAVDGAAEAVDLIKQGVAELGDVIEDLGRVSDGLPQVLSLPTRSFALSGTRRSMTAAAAIGSRADISRSTASQQLITLSRRPYCAIF